MNKRTFNNYLTESNFRELFISEMGWNNPTGATQLPEYTIDEKEFAIEQIADCRGFQILHCEVNEIPTSTICKKLDTKLRKNAEHYILIFSVPGTLHHLWVTPVKKVEKRDLVLVEYDTIDKASFLYEKMEGLSFSFDAQPTIIDVIDRVQNAFIVNSEKITKDFYAGFKKEHTNFVKFISGIDDQIADKDNKKKQWYTSVMLNRLMFCYFIQKKGFLDGDEQYLRTKLEWTQREKGENRFFSTFYKGFLVSLFHDGLNAPEHDAEFEKTYGRIPYLNGGMFDVHELENEYKGHDIADEAFISLFDFFDKWHWHLDDRMTATGKDINPDVLGYIFEQYINDRAQMGAYYTKEDITEYIGRNTIIPYLIDAVKNENDCYFTPSGEIWSFLKGNYNRYIFDVVKKGSDKEIPSKIAIGIDTSGPNLIERRKYWNERTADEFALPTEIWRETMERLQRYNEIKTKLINGEITDINDFITYNIDIRKFIFDLLNQTRNVQFIKDFYKQLQNITILDPTCGSGAFLFAALNILEPLYEVCIIRMQEFHEKNNTLFVEELKELKDKYRSNIQYFIYKSIILRNLYGVDIMVEAIEIAKLRLFLKMVAVVEVDKRDKNLGLDPLPDIDFNIRCGNTLVGYANNEELEEGIAYSDFFTAQEFRNRVGEEMERVAETYTKFKYCQLSQAENMLAYKQAKHDLKNRLSTLNELLNHQMYGSVDSSAGFDSWLHSHQPFHWLAEFYEIINGNGGFDVIIGNPPYVEYKKVKGTYQLNTSLYKTIDCGNLHAYVAERTFTIGKKIARIGLIVPLPSMNTQRMETLQNIIKPQKGNRVWISCYDERPSGLFNGVDQRLIIELISKNNEKSLFTTGIRRWLSDNRGLLFKTVLYTENSSDATNLTTSILKFKSPIEMDMIKKLYNDGAISCYKTSMASAVENNIYYRTAGGRYWKVFLDKPFGTNNASEKDAIIYPINKYVIISVLSSDVFWWYYSLHFDMFNLKDYMIFAFRFIVKSSNEEETLKRLGKEYIQSLEDNAISKEISAKHGSVLQKQYYVRKSKPILEKIDKALANHYDFTDEELDFIINYDIKYRMGEELCEE